MAARMVLWITFAMAKVLVCGTLEAWHTMYKCDDSTHENALRCRNWTESLGKRVVIYSKLQSSPNRYLHYIWSSVQGPAIYLAQTKQNCSVYVSPELFMKASPEGVISLKYHESTCIPIHGYQVIELGALLEVDGGNIVTRHQLQHCDDVQVSQNDTEYTAQLWYMNRTIVFQFTLQLNDKNQTNPPYYLLPPFSNLFSLALSNATVKSCNSSFQLQFFLGSSMNASTYHFNPNASFSDILSPGTFHSFELYTSDRTESMVASSFFWRDLAFTDHINSMPSSICATHLSTPGDCDRRFYRLVSLVGSSSEIASHCGRINFETISHENCYFAKSYLMWQGVYNFNHPAQEKLPFYITILLILCYALPLSFSLIFSVIAYRYHKHGKPEYFTIDDSSTSSEL